MSWSHPFLPDPGLPLVLASRSPRRSEILNAHSLHFVVDPAEVEEVVLPGESPAAHVERLAVDKARAVAARHTNCMVMGCDTVVVIDDDILGKPRDEAEARAMLARLAGREHVVHSSIALLTHEGEAFVDHDTTRVVFRELAEGEIAAYVASGEPMDKAGAYGIQGAGAMLVAGIEGGYFTVMGLPLSALHRTWLRFVQAHEKP